MIRSNKQIKCRICDQTIDRGACDNDYMIITEIDNKHIPIHKRTSYICTDCNNVVINSILNAIIHS